METFLRVGGELSLAIIVLTVALMQVLKPYARSFVQRAAMRSSLVDPDARWIARELMEPEIFASAVDRYPELQRKLERFSPGGFDRPKRAMLFEAQYYTGVRTELLMRVFQNEAQALIERPTEDLSSYVLLTRGAALHDRVAGVLLGSPGRERVRAETPPKREDTDDGAKSPSPSAIVAATVRGNLAAAVDRNLDRMQVTITATWQLVGRWLSISVGIAAALCVGVAAGALSAGGLFGGALLLVLLTAAGAFAPVWIQAFWRMNRADDSRQLLRRAMPLFTFLIPILAFAVGIALLRRWAGDHLITFILIGAVSGLLASLLYEAGTGLVRRA